MRRYAADFLGMQETKIAEGDVLAAAEQNARNSKWNVSITPCRVTEVGGKSAGVAVATRNHIGMAEAEPARLTQDLHQRGRFSIRRVGAICRGGLHLGSTYLTSGIGVEAKCNLDHLQGMAHTLNCLVGPWCVGGDWNCTPEELTATGWLQLVKGAVHAPIAPTCNGKVYDFFVVSQSFSHAVVSTHTVGDAGLTPHSPVRLLIKDKPRQLMVRQLQTPMPLPAQLPFGPMRDHTFGTELAGLSDGTIDEHYVAVVTKVELILNELTGATREQVAKSRSRAHGPRFVWKNACGPPATDKCRSTPVSRAWRLMAGWLRTVRMATTEADANAARWKLLFYRHQLQVDDPRMQQARCQVIAWQRLLTGQMLRSAYWVEALGKVATAMAEDTERAANVSASKAFADWLQDGPAGGLKRQHLLTRTASGWIPTKVAEEAANVTMEPEELDGLSQAQLEEVARMPDGCATPLCAQH